MQLTVTKRLSDNWIECSTTLTKHLDKLSGRDSILTFWRRNKHYILIDGLSFIDHQFAIRVPGGTVGYVKLDDRNFIKAITLYPDSVVKTYPDNINELLKVHIGKPFDLPEGFIIPSFTKEDAL